MKLSRNNNFNGLVLEQFTYGRGIHNTRKWLGPGQTRIDSDIIAFDQAASSMSYIDSQSPVSTRITTLESAAPSLKVIATPDTGNMAELLTGVIIDPLNGVGQFRYSDWDSNAVLATLDGDLNSAQTDKPFLGMTFWGSTANYKGTLVIALDDATRNTLNTIFFPMDAKTIHTARVESGTVTAMSQSTWNFSNNQGAASGRGYSATNRFSTDDGCWGFNNGGSVDGNSPGPALSATTGYGFNNYNAGDTAANTLFWGGSSGQNVQCYVFTAFA